MCIFCFFLLAVTNRRVDESGNAAVVAAPLRQDHKANVFGRIAELGWLPVGLNLGGRMSVLVGEASATPREGFTSNASTTAMHRTTR